MKLYFLRHAEALEGAPDAARPLSEEGKLESVRIAEFCKKAGIIFDAAYTSPLVRARETAELVLKITNASLPVDLQEAEELLNETEPADFHKWLDAVSGPSHVLIVGHNPSLSERVSQLLGLPRPSSLTLPKGGLACIKTRDVQRCALKFFISPKVL